MDYMTVGKLRESLTGLADDVVVAISCENRCEPHPITGGHFVPGARAVRNRTGGEDTPITIVTLWQNEGADIMLPYEDDDDE